MKKEFTFKWLFLSLATLIMPCMQVPAQVKVTQSREIKLTFAGRGESKTVDEVLVENLSNGQSVQLNGQDTLLLNVKTSTTNIENVYDDDNNNAIYIFDDKMLINLEYPGEINIYVYGLNGTTIYRTSMDASSDYASVIIPPLPKGVYMIRATAPGLDKSVKWLGGYGTSFTISASTAIDWTSYNELQYSDPQQPMYVTSNIANGVHMDFTEGDVLRFTGTSGNMTTIYTLSPRSSHPVYFDFYRCQDADGYNYTIVRAGDMLWMAENLRKVNNANLTYANALASDALAGLITNPNIALVGTDDNTGQAYYSKAGAIKAMPEGWRLPTQGELDYAIKEFNGGDYNTVGKWFKTNGFSVDSTSLKMNTNGYYNGSIANTGTCYLMTRSTKGGEMLVMQINADESVQINTLNGYLIPVRGVRAAPSAYNEMMETFGCINKVKQKTPSDRTLDRGPLGKTYTMYDMGQSIAFDFSSGQYNSGSSEARSGVLYKDTTNNNWNIHTNRDKNFLSDCGNTNYDNNVLRKMAAMSNGDGTQNIVEMQWSRRFLIRVEYNGSYIYSDQPEVFSRAHEDGVYLTIAGDHNSGYSVMNAQTENGFHKGFYLPLNAYLKPISREFLDFSGWEIDSRRHNESRMDYLQRVFQLLTADFNQDGVDELVICIDGEVWVYDGSTLLNSVKNDTIDQIYTGAPLYHKNFNFETDSIEKNASYCSIQKLVTRFAVGDVDGDDIPDITVLQVGVTDTITGDVNAEVMLFHSGNVEAAPIAQRVIANDYSDAIFLDVKVGNVSGGKYDDIILFFRNYNDTEGFSNKGLLWRAMYDPNEPNGHLFAETDSTYVVNSFTYDSRHVGNNNLTLAHLRGNGYPYDVVVGADLWQWNDASQKLQYQFPILPMFDNEIWSIYADNIIAADEDADGRDALFSDFYLQKQRKKGPMRMPTVATHSSTIAIGLLMKIQITLCSNLYLKLGSMEIVSKPI